MLYRDRASVVATLVVLGLILADFVVVSVLNIIAIILHIPCYRFVD